ncbi:MAG: heme biosynthesis HemY N-terminal domain-containing protein [Gallionella sp.]|nr:heme biosynthesis HemY N-terminal domain-containing protein [Gallionella sp.]MDD4945565.1 heme biosynthesis HemY N-terminal domain-containing protein [Gallionella sp.]MDD5612985.1 heme biosynthesis HemY N-terminal domain-containing protein [Gallionella sp.]
MKYLVSILVLFALAVALSTLLQNGAYVLLVYPPYRIELSLRLFVLLLLATFGLVYWLTQMFYLAVRLPELAHKMRLERAQHKARKLLDIALSSFFEGRYAEAEKAAARAIKMGETSALYPIVAARAAHELAAIERRDAYMSAVGDRTAGETTMRFMTAARFKLDQHDPQGALKDLQTLRESGMKLHSGALSMELKAQQEAGNWDGVLEVLAQLEKRKAIDAPLADRIRRHALAEKGRQG